MQQGTGFSPCNSALWSDTYWPKTLSTSALVAPQVAEGAVNYLEDTDNQYSFQVLHKRLSECNKAAAFRSHNLQFIWGT